MSDNIEVDEEVVQQLTEVADTMARLLDKVMAEHSNQNKDMDHFRADLALVRDSIRHIAKVLHEGNGERPLISRVAVLEEKVDNLEDDVTKVEEDVTRMELYAHETARTEDEKENINKKGKWALIAALLTGGSALVVEIVRFLS